jgi:glycosyltransferase involved in cell wall biosynthesis
MNDGMDRDRILIDTPSWFISKRNTDWLYMKKLNRLAEYIPLEVIRCSSSYNDMLASSAYLKQRLGFRSALTAHVNRTISHRTLETVRPCAILNNSVPPRLSEGRPPILWRHEVIDPKMLKSGGQSDSQIEGHYNTMGSFLERTAKVFVASDASKRRHKIHFPEHASKFETVPFFLPQLQRVEPQFVIDKHIKDKEIRLTFVGGQTRRKGLDIIYKAILQLPILLSNRLHVTVVSIEEQRPQLKGVKFTYHKKLSNCQIQNLLHHTHIFAMPSRIESYGFVLIEAMAAGCAVIGPDWETQREILNHNRAGINCPASTSQCLSAITRLMTNRQVRTELALAGNQRFSDKYAADHVAELYHRYIREAIK